MNDGKGKGASSEEGLHGQGEKLGKRVSHLSQIPDDKYDGGRVTYDAARAGAPSVPDGGYGWAIVFAAFMCNFIVDGMANSFSLFLIPLTDDLHADKSSVAWANSLLVGVYMLVGPPVSALTNRFGCRKVCIIGALVAASGFALSALSPNLEVLILTYGIIGGIGFGLIYLPSNICVGYYFESRRAIATGIAVCGSGVGTMAFPQIANLLLKHLNWKYIHLIYAGIILTCAGMGMLMRPLELQVELVEDDEDKEDITSKGSSSYFMVQLPDGTMERRLKIPLNADPEQAGSVLGGTSTSGRRAPRSISRNDSAPQFNNAQSSHNNGSMLVSYKAVPWGSTHPVNKISRLNLQERRRSSIRNSMLSFAGSKSKMNARDDDYSMLSKSKQELTDGLFLISTTKSQAEPRHIIRPMSRKDIFYSGAITNLQEFQSQRNIANYRQSVLNLPRASTLAATDANADADAGASDEEKEIPQEKSKKPSKCPCPCICFGSGGAGAFKSTLAQMMDFSLIKNPIFVFIIMSNIFAMLGFYVPIIYIANAAIDILEADPSAAALLLSIFGITNTIGRILAGVLSDLPHVNSLFVSNMSIFLSGVLIAFIPLCTSYLAYAIIMGLFGLIIAAYISLTSIILVDLLGLDNLTNAFGLLILFRGGASILGAPFAGAMYETFQIYDIPFWLAGGFFVVSSFCSFLIPCVSRLPRPRPSIQAPDYQVGYLDDFSAPVSQKSSGASVNMKPVETAA